MTVVVVTGAGSGIGAAAAREFATRGASVVCADIRLDAAATVAASLADAVAVEVDVRDEVSCEALARLAADRYGGIDVAVTCAGIEVHGAGHELSLADFERVVGVNQTGTFLTARAVARVMITGGRGGRIVLVGSTNSVIAKDGLAAYASSKGGVLMLGKALAADWAPYGITVNVVGPGLVDTPMSAASLADPDRRRWLFDRIPLRRSASPDEVAKVVAFLASPEAGYVTGAFVPVDGGRLIGA